ncbi:acyltransferase [Streptacidiphilus cavernicola]|uniref:Acyltransferase n=1 Tax=Streptacidiphilus cavernicola TaxID=3342716 RepID=A0ABV6VS60_9ACTN
MNFKVQPSAQVDPTAGIGAGSSIWDLAQIRENASLGERCVVGRGAYVGPGVRIGSDVKIQNHALVYEPAELADGVFIGPAVVLTNDHNPRSVDPDGKQKRGGDWEAVAVTVAEGASVGARSVCVAPVHVGRWSLVAAGSVVTRDVPDFALVAGVPARRIGWVGRVGVRLVERTDEPGVWECPQSGSRYQERDGVLSELG